MLKLLNQFILRLSGSWVLIVLAAVLAVGSMAAMMQIAGQFRAATGHEPFDLQNALTAGQVLAQLPTYTDSARQLYYAFTAIDYLFPLAAGLFLAAIAVACLRLVWPALYAALLERNLLPLLLLPTLFDWCENIAAVAAINAWPDTTPAMAAVLVTAKRLKLGFLVLTQGITAVLILWAAITWLRRRLQRS